MFLIISWELRWMVGNSAIIQPDCRRHPGCWFQKTDDEREEEPWCKNSSYVPGLEVGFMTSTHISLPRTAAAPSHWQQGQEPMFIFVPRRKRKLVWWELASLCRTNGKFLRYWYILCSSYLFPASLETWFSRLFSSFVLCWPFRGGLE